MSIKTWIKEDMNEEERAKNKEMIDKAKEKYKLNNGGQERNGERN